MNSITITKTTTDPMKSHEVMESGRAEAAQALGAQPSEIVIASMTSGGDNDPEDPTKLIYSFSAVWKRIDA